MRVTLYLLREDAPFSNEVLRGSGYFTPIDTIPSDRETEWKLFARAGDAKSPSWVENINPIVINSSDLDFLHSQSSSGVLLVRVVDSIFAVTFGGGYHALNPKFIQQGFGLRVAANVIGSKQITSADTKGFSRSSRNQKTILASADEFFALGIEPSEEWVRQLGGKVAIKEFASTASGADSLRLSIKDFSLTDLPHKIRQISTHYASVAYKEKFGFLDTFIRIDQKDPLVAELDGRAEELVRKKDWTVAFAAPDPFEQLHVDHFLVQYRKLMPVPDLTVEDMFAALDVLRLPQGFLRKVHVDAINDDGELIDKRFELYDYVQVEVDHDGNRYALTSGSWFRIDRDYLKEINDYVSGIPDITDDLRLPKWDKEDLDADDNDKTAEGSYNKRVAERPRFELLDKRNLYWSQTQKIEVCDLMTDSRHLICVKRATKSSTLSHLFAQGHVSATLMREPKYQDRLRRHLENLGVDNTDPASDGWTFVYAIAIDKPEPLVECLFFFSKVNLVTSAREIRSRGFGVALAKIDIV